MCAERFDPIVFARVVIKIIPLNGPACLACAAGGIQDRSAVPQLRWALIAAWREMEGVNSPRTRAGGWSMEIRVRGPLFRPQPSQAGRILHDTMTRRLTGFVLRELPPPSRSPPWAWFSGLPGGVYAPKGMHVARPIVVCERGIAP